MIVKMNKLKYFGSSNKSCGEKHKTLTNRAYARQDENAMADVKPGSRRVNSVYKKITDKTEIVYASCLQLEQRSVVHPSCAMSKRVVKYFT